MYNDGDYIVCENIVRYTHLNKVFNTKQYGFISNRSTALELLR